MLGWCGARDGGDVVHLSVAEAEAAAAASETRLRLAHEAAELGSWQWHMSTGLVVWDERLEALFGLQPGGYDGTFDTWLAMIHPDHRDDVMVVVNRALEERSSYRLEMRVVWPDGSEHWVESYGRVTTDEDDQPTGTIGCVWDVNARHQVEDLTRTMREEQTRLADRLADISEHLQTSLAASPLPDVPGVSMAVHYAPGGDELEHVGGDWYDAVRTADGALACVVGDVMGRGVLAATTMVRVRAGIRGLLTVDTSPEVLLGHADDMLERDAPDQFVTAVAVLLDPVSGRITLCNAGHVPVVVTDADGSVHLVGEGTGLPLGLPEGRAREAVEEVLAPGSTVVMVTDGVVESTDRDVDEGIDRLRAAVADHAAEPAEVLVDAVARLADRTSGDDVTVVAVRYA
jgi:PAS domain S-box-containing protein